MVRHPKIFPDDFLAALQSEIRRTYASLGDEANAGMVAAVIYRRHRKDPAWQRAAVLTIIAGVTIELFGPESAHGG